MTETSTVLSSRDSICPNMEPNICPNVLAPSVAEHVSPHFAVPADLSLKNILEVIDLITPLHFDNMDNFVEYGLPFKHNCGKPSNRYSPDIEERKSRYPIANYVSTKGLSVPLEKFARELFSC